MIKKILISVTWLLCILTITGFSNTSDRPILDIYKQAIAIKSSDPKLSQELLFRLNHRREELTTDQRIELVYLTGYLETMRGKYYRALDVHHNLTLTGKPHIALRAYADMLQIKVLLRDYGGASQFVPKILEIINNESFAIPSNILHNTLITLISFYNQLSQFDKAETYIEKLTKYQLTSREQCFADVQQTQTDVHLGKIKLTDKSIKATQNFCLSIDEEPLVQNYIADLARIYIERQQYQDAINLLNKEIERSKTIHTLLNKAEYNAYLASGYMHLGNAILAEKYAFETLKYVDNLNEPLPKTWAYDVLYKYALQQGDHIAAVEYLKQYSNAYDEFTQLIHLKALGIEQGKQGLMSIEDDVVLYDNRLKLNNAMQLAEKQGNDSFRSYRLIQITIEVLFLLLVSYQVFSSYRVRQKIKAANANSVNDPSTKEYHRHEFIIQAENTLKQQAANNKLCGLLILNLDDMARINLIHNSDRGDWVIKYGIQACRKVCTNNEIIGRIGGDEFAILMTEQSLAEIKLFANKILQTFQQLDTSKVTYRFDSNCSIGVSDTQTSGYHLQQLLNDADTALRTAKAEGKNRVIHVIDTR